MAVNRNNPVVEGASGRFGNTLVFRQRGRVTIMATRPTRTTHVATEEQMNRRFLFMEACLYATSVLEDPVKKAAYQAKAKPNQSAYNVAFKDFLVAPILHLVDWSKYRGAIGDLITCRITDVLAVVDVRLSLYDVDGVLIEEGPAVQANLKLDWVYTATVAHTPIAGMRVVVEMTDTPGNVYRDEAVIG